MYKKNKRKKKFNGNDNYRKEITTFDPKIHHRSKGNPGYGYRRDVNQPEEELQGSQLQGMFNKWGRKD